MILSVLLIMCCGKRSFGYTIKHETERVLYFGSFQRFLPFFKNCRTNLPVSAISISRLPKAA